MGVDISHVHTKHGQRAKAFQRLAGIESGLVHIHRHQLHRTVTLIAPVDNIAHQFPQRHFAFSRNVMRVAGPVAVDNMQMT